MSTQRHQLVTVVSSVVLTVVMAYSVTIRYITQSDTASEVCKLVGNFHYLFTMSPTEPGKIKNTNCLRDSWDEPRTRCPQTDLGDNYCLFPMIHVLYVVYSDSAGHELSHFQFSVIYCNPVDLYMRCVYVCTFVCLDTCVIFSLLGHNSRKL